MHTKEVNIGNSVKITLSSGQLAPQANASVLATMGGTSVLATVVMGKLDETRDYFPLQVEFVDNLYAGGVIKGSKWIKREYGPSDDAILFGRIIDRSIRPLFPEGFKNEVQIVASVLSNDGINDPVVTAFTAVSAALQVSDIPFSSPVSAIRVGLLNKEITLNPNLEQLKKSDLDLLVCIGPQGVNMIEAEANIVDNDTVLDAINQATKAGEKTNQEITEFALPVAKEKIEFKAYLPSEELINQVKDFIQKDLDAYIKEGQENNQDSGRVEIYQKVTDHFQEQIDGGQTDANLLNLALEEIFKKSIRTATLAGKRFDKRSFDQIRSLHIETGVLPQPHGSALFQRGLTQVITFTTLDSLTEKQYLQDSAGETTKRYIHYYSALPFSTGQTGRIGRPGRREIGHGALAEKALRPVIPTENEFPYTIILNSEVLSQNGSSSMASTCGSCLSLMDAGVPIKEKVAGISVGMMSQGDKYVLLTDIAGIEDHNGDMDFKITGTRNGITAIQLDIKRTGLTHEMIVETFKASTIARLQILDAMDAAMPAVNDKLAPNAPKIKVIKLPEDKIGDVIGSGGKTIKALMKKHQVQIDVDDEGLASISAIDPSAVDSAAQEISAMIREVEIGEEFDGVVTRVENYGAFVEFLPGREALLHVSEMTGGYLDNPSSIIKIGDQIKIKISGFNDNRQIKLSAPEFKSKHPGVPRQDSPRRSSFESKGRDFPKFNNPGFRSQDRKR